MGYLPKGCAERWCDICRMGYCRMGYLLKTTMRKCDKILKKCDKILGKMWYFFKENVIKIWEKCDKIFEKCDKYSILYNIALNGIFMVMRYLWQCDICYNVIFGEWDNYEMWYLQNGIFAEWDICRMG